MATNNGTTTAATWALQMSRPAHPWLPPMRPRPGDGESIGWTKLVVGGLLGAFAGLVGWVAVTAPPPVERPLRFGKDADPEVLNRIAPRARCAMVARAGDEVRPALEALQRCLAERGVLPR